MSARRGRERESGDDDSRVITVPRRARTANLRKQRQTTGAAGGDGGDDHSGEPAEGDEGDRERGDAVEEKKSDDAKEEERGGEGAAMGEPANDDKVVAPAKVPETKSAPAKKTQPRERKASAATKGTKRKGLKQDEHEIAEALFDLATLAADADKEPDGKASKRKKPRATKKASAPAGGAKTSAKTVLGAGDAAPGGLPPVYAGMGLPPLGAFPPPVPLLGVANPFHAQVPRTKPFRNATAHVYIAHFIDFTQKVSKQTMTVHQDASAAAAAAKGGDETQASREQMGDASTSGAPFGGMPPGGFSPFMMNPYLMGALMAGQPMGPGGGGPDASQQTQLLNMMMQQAASVPMFGGANQAMGFPPPMGMMNPSQQSQGGGGERGGAGADSNGGVNPYLAPMFAMQNPMLVAAMMGSAMPPHMMESIMHQQDVPRGNEKVGAPAGDAPPAGTEAPKVEAK